MNKNQSYHQDNNSKGYQTPLKISSEEEFLEFIEDIDRELANEGIKITARPIVAELKIAKRYGITFNGFPPNRPAKAGSFEPVELSIRIHEWFKKRYGKKLNLPSYIGKTIVFLRGELYVINCPITYGTVRFICEPTSLGKVRENIGLYSPPICNMLDWIEDITPDFAFSLSIEEVLKISVVFTTAMGVYPALNSIRETAYVEEIMGDFDAAVFHLIEHNPKPGLSKWSTLQAVEKLIKAYIINKGGEVKRIHSLKKLAKQAVEIGLPEPPEKYIEDIQCSAGVRYGEVSVSIEEAIRAHIVSLELSECIIRCIAIELKRDIPTVPNLKVDGIPLEQFLKKYTK